MTFGFQWLPCHWLSLAMAPTSGVQGAVNGKAVTKPWGTGAAGSFPDDLVSPTNKGWGLGGWNLVSGSPNTISRAGAGRQGATSDSKEATQHALVRQHLSLKEASARKMG